MYLTQKAPRMPMSLTLGYVDLMELLAYVTFKITTVFARPVFRQLTGQLSFTFFNESGLKGSRLKKKNFQSHRSVFETLIAYQCF